MEPMPDYAPYTAKVPDYPHAVEDRLFQQASTATYDTRPPACAECGTYLIHQDSGTLGEGWYCRNANCPITHANAQRIEDVNWLVENGVAPTPYTQ